MISLANFEGGRSKIERKTPLVNRKKNFNHVPQTQTCLKGAKLKFMSLVFYAFPWKFSYIVMFIVRW